MVECAGLINHGTGSDVAFHPAMGFAKDKPGKRPTMSIDYRAASRGKARPHVATNHEPNERTPSACHNVGVWSGYQTPSGKATSELANLLGHRPSITTSIHAASAYETSAV